MFEKLMWFFEKKAVWEKQGYTYRWATFGMWDKVDTNLDLYYRLYRGNTDLRRCIEELYQTTWKDWYKLYRWEAILENSPIEEILDYENWFLSLKSKIIRDLEIAGNVFILNVLNARWQIIGFQILDPRTIRIVANQFWEIIKYFQTVKWYIQEYNADEIWHFKDMVDHDNEIMGISKVETLCYDILADKEAWRSNYSFFLNNAIPSTIIYLDNEMDEQEQRIALESLKTQFSGWENKHKVSASSLIKDVKVIGQTMKDMEFIALRHFTTEKICCAMWVPKTILGYSDNINFSTSDNQYRKFIENSIKPLEYQIEKIITTLINQIDPNIQFEFEDKHEFDLNDKVARNEKLLNIWVRTINEVREELGFIPFTDENANKIILKTWYTYLDDVGVDNTAPLDTIENNG